jgi:hypothetical protein
MSRVVARWPLKNTKSGEALAIVSGWQDDDSVRSYLGSIFSNVAVISISNRDEACILAEERFGPKHLQFFGRDEENIKNVIEYDGFEQFDCSIGDFVDPVKVVIQTSAKWAVYPINDNETHTNFYFADLNAATEFKLKFG